MRKSKGITLIALVITIIVLLILAGVSLSLVMGNEGILGKVEKSSTAHIRGEMKEQLILALQELQIDKLGKATLDDITQEYLDGKITEYKNKITKDEQTNSKKVVMDKNGIKGRFIIDWKLNITQDTGIDFRYEVIEKDGNNIKISITVRDEESGISKIELLGEEPLIYHNVEEVKDLEYIIELGKEYTVWITTGDGEVKEEKILIEPEIEITQAYVNTMQNATTSLETNSVEKGANQLYISFTATLNGSNCTIEPPLTEAITKNGKYIYTIIGTYNGKTITKTKEVIVDQYKSAIRLVQYDAGEWTKEEIEELQNLRLYDLNKSYSRGTRGKYKLKSPNDGTALSFTFGGFSYKNSQDSNETGIITSRNESVSNSEGIPYFEGWQILETEMKDEKEYVKKITHTGSPENFVFYEYAANDGYRAEFLFGVRQGWNTLHDGTPMNPRSWDMYKDKSQDNLIDNVHLMTENEFRNCDKNIQKIGTSYWLATSYGSEFLYAFCRNNGSLDKWGSDKGCYGIRPVIEMKDGVYIKSGDGSETSPYILGKD